MKKVLAMLLVLMTLMSFSAITASAESNEDFTIAYNGIVTLNPIMSQSSNDHNIFYLTQMQLIRYYEGQIQMDAAESYEMNEDATVFTFKLRDGLTYADGTALTAADFAYTMELILDPEAGSPAAASWYCIKNAEAYSTGAEDLSWEDVGVKVLDDATIEFTLEMPLSTFDQTVAYKHIYPLNREFVESVGADKIGSSADTMMYSGAYVMTEWVLESSMELVKNENYWDAENSFPVKNIHLLEIEDPNTEVAMFEMGEVDAIEQISAQYYDYLNDYAYRTSGGGFMFLWMNENGTGDEAQRVMSNVNFRQALNYGFDRESTCRVVNSATTAATRLVDPSFAGVNGDTFVNEYAVDTVPAGGDTEKAMEYLNKAMEELGYSDVSEFPTLSMVTWDATEQKLLCETIIDQWKQNLGLNCIQLNQYVIGTAIGSFFDLSYDIFVITWETDVLPTDIMEAMMTGGECNAGIWSNEEFDALVDAAVAELDAEKRAELTQQAEQVFLNEAAIQPIYLQGEIHAVQSYVEGFSISANGNGFAFNNLNVNK